MKMETEIGAGSWTLDAARWRLVMKMAMDMEMEMEMALSMDLDLGSRLDGWMEMATGISNVFPVG